MKNEEVDGIAEFYQGENGKTFSNWQINATLDMARKDAYKFKQYTGRALTILDFGCGSGAILSSLTSIPNRIGIEANATSRAFAVENGILAYDRLRYVEHSSVDLIISHHALEHCVHPLAEVKRMANVLSPGGKVVIITPYDSIRQKMHRKYRKDDVNHHLYTWTPLLLGNLFSEGGFVIEEARLRNHAFPPGARLLWRHLPQNLYDLVSFIWSKISGIDEVLLVAKIVK